MLSVATLTALAVSIVLSRVVLANVHWAPVNVLREGLTIAADGRLVSFLPSPDRAGWVRQDDERASARFGVLGARPGEPALLALASLGARNYLAVRADGLLARLDAARGEELWRVSAAGIALIASHASTRSPARRS